MTPAVELLIQDIKDEKTDIENLSKNDFKQVFETYNSLYNRCINLKEEDFDNPEIYHRFIKHVKMINNSEFITLSWLKNGIDSVSADKFSQLRDILNSFVITLKYAW
ncbi:hypothetical protein FNW25_15515 [Flavobacterium franklandianum]|uniref:hypothetical protein n=1 Tax=Flavobacterium franklandianum TaxID=2594430 RepID=UPI00117AD182|nr:hypothetical protein [Flavobacterium franklandianum]TRX21847.1 hypothetical protein FNW25_15515 [Flavobacterium franklandianum]